MNDEEQKPENGGKAEREGAAEVNRRGKLKGAHSDYLGSSRSLKNEKGKNPALSSLQVIHEGFGDTGDGEPEEYVAHDWINEKNMTTLNLSSIIGIDPNQFDPATYVEEDFYVIDASGVNRLIPPTNIIRWREVTNPDGTTSVESNTRFVTWSDGSLQLLIGKEAFGISEQDAQGIESYLFLRHEQGIYQSQGLISRKMIVMPSFVTSNSNFD
ncbi:UNVERIFIED_CONTAM: protein LEO1 [Sesamum calycinum]|uniref:Protein LEO1 n=1 Tax=Sesamum calycinum TaxID=2727403 RepID=A0AAW2NG89_9LAMI